MYLEHIPSKICKIKNLYKHIALVLTTIGYNEHIKSIATSSSVETRYSDEEYDKYFLIYCYLRSSRSGCVISQLY